MCRYLGTLRHSLRWYNGPLEMLSSLRAVRRQHREAAVRARDVYQDQGISQFDMVVTQWGFVGNK